MAGRHEKIYDINRTGSQIPSNEASNRITFEHKTTRRRRENHNLTGQLSSAAWPTMQLDPIQRLPHEISTFIIQDTLRPDNAYSSRRYTPQLLELTAVSRIWRDFLLTTPVLWSKIYLDETQQDFLATVATFVHLSGQVALRVGIYDRPISSWAGLSSILAPVHQRITSLAVLHTIIGGGDESETITSAISDIFDQLGHLPQLRDLVFVDQVIPTISAFGSLDLPSTIRLYGLLGLSIPPSARSSETPGRLFDIRKYNSFGPTPLVAPLLRSCTLSLAYEGLYTTTVEMGGEVLSQLKRSSKYITDLAVNPAITEYGLERLTHIMGTNVCSLNITVSLSDIDDVVNFLRLLTRLEILSLGISESKLEGTTEIASSSIVVPQLRSLEVGFTYQLNVPSHTVALSLRGLFSVLTPLYPGVESFLLDADTWSFSASPYMESLRKLKYLHLDQAIHPSDFDFDNGYDAENDPITLNHLERLELGHGVSIHRLRTPNLLSLHLESMEYTEDIKHLGISCLRKLRVGQWSCFLNPSDFPVLPELELGMYKALKAVDILSFSSIRSIRLTTYNFINTEGNHLCTTLLYYPKVCPSLQELHFDGCLEWDILFLMLERRNFGLNGVKRIHTVTLRFVPFLIRPTLTSLLAGEATVRLPLESISLEATRELLFDPTVLGCGSCLKNMVPTCREKFPSVDFLYPWTPDELYPEHSYQGDAVPDDILDWMNHHKHLVDVWKSSCEEFQLRFRRQERCDRDPMHSRSQGGAAEDRVHA